MYADWSRSAHHYAAHAEQRYGATLQSQTKASRGGSEVACGVAGVDQHHHAGGFLALQGFLKPVQVRMP